MAVVNDIATAIKTLVDAVSGMPTSTIRKADVVPPRSSLPVTNIAYLTETPEEWAALGAGGTDRGTVGIVYDFVIAIYRAGSGDLASGATTNPNILEDLREAINRGSLTGASTVWVIELTNHPQWEPDAYGSGGEVSRFEVRVGSSEARNG